MVHINVAIHVLIDGAERILIFFGKHEHQTLIISISSHPGCVEGLEFAVAEVTELLGFIARG